MLSGTNPRVRLARALVARRKDRWEERAFVVQGEVLLTEALSASWVPRFVLSRDDFVADRALSSMLRVAADGDRVDVHLVEGQAFDALNDTATPQGVLGVFEMPEEVAPECGMDDWYIVADRVADPGNLGTMIRSAEAAGASGVIVTSGTTDPYSPKTVRASAGAFFHVPVHFVDDLSNPALAPMRLVGTTSHVDGDVPSLWEADLTGCLGFVFGNEPRGMAADAPVRSWIRIPHAGRSESLNVAMAASVVAMYTAHHRSVHGVPRAIQPAPRGASD